MKEITSKSTVNEVLNNIGLGEQESLRESRRRERNLEKFARLRSRNPHISLGIADTKTAYAYVDGDPDDDSTNQKIVVSSKKVAKIYPELPDNENIHKFHDYMVQKAYTIHEVGHILFTDWSDYMETIQRAQDEFDSDKKVEMYKDFYNIIEDGFIETYLAENYNVDEELSYLRYNIHEKDSFGKFYPDQGKYIYGMLQSIYTAALNIAVYDNGNTERLLNKNNNKHEFPLAEDDKDRERFVAEILPEMRDKIDDIMQMRDSHARSWSIYSLWEELMKYINVSTSPGTDRYQGKDQNYHDQTPQNISDSHGDRKKKPQELKGGSESEEDENEDGDDGETEDYSFSSEDIEGEEVEEKAKKGLEEEGVDSDIEEEIEDTIEALGAGEGDDTLSIAPRSSPNDEIYDEAISQGKNLYKIFADRLRMSRKNNVARNQRRGKFDKSRMMNGARGEMNIYKKERESKEKNYSCIIVCDRSGSMRDKIKEVEITAGSLAYALQELDVDVSLLDTYDSHTTLAKPFGADVEDFAGELFSERYGGGTPLGSTIRYANERMYRGRGMYPFMVIITDGRPSDRGLVEEQVTKANFPVLGIYMSEKDVESQLKLYDNAVQVQDLEKIGGKVRDLVNSVIF